MDANNGTHIKIVDPAAAGTAATSTSTNSKFNSFSKEQASNGETESIFDEETAGRREGDYKRKQVRHLGRDAKYRTHFAPGVHRMDAHVVCMTACCAQSRLTLLDRLAYQSTGVIYGTLVRSWRFHSDDPKAILEPVLYTSIRPLFPPTRATKTSWAPCP
jgi:hypothetical protein